MVVVEGVSNDASRDDCFEVIELSGTERAEIARLKNMVLSKKKTICFFVYCQAPNNKILIKVLYTTPLLKLRDLFTLN